MDNKQFTPVTCHAHPVIEMQITNFRKDEIGYFADCRLYNKDTNTVESSFFLDEQRAIEIKNLMEQFLIRTRDISEKEYKNLMKALYPKTRK